MNIRGHRVSAAVSLLVILFLWAPLLIVVLNAFNKDELLVGWAGATLRWFRTALHDSEARDALGQSLVIGVTSTTISVLLAVTGAMWWRRASRRARRWYELLVLLNVILPEVVFASAMFLLFVRLHIQLGLPAVVIGHTVWNTAYAILIIQARMSVLEPALEEAAADLGAARWQVFLRVTLPGLLPGLLVAGLLAFTFSFDDVVTSFFMAGSSVNTLPLELLGLIRFRVTPEVNAIGAVAMLVTAGTAMTGYAIASRVNRARHAGVPFGFR
ncbi:MAG: ABC transporter permease [Actinobacteria bacterium]|nr:ABC transporter permease [Actinomycetota bacterium]